METKKKAALIIDTIFIVFFAFLFYVIFKYCIVYLLPFLLSFLFVYFLQKPMILISEKTKIPKGILTVLTLIFFIALLLVVCVFVFSKVSDYIIEIFSDESSYNLNPNGIISSLNSLLGLIPRNLKDSLNISSESIIDSFNGFVFSFGESFIKSFIKKLPSIILSVLISLVSACFFAFDYDNIINFIKRQLSEKAIGAARSIKRIVNFSVYSLFKGYFIIMLITFSEALLGLYILGIENAFVLAIIIASVDILPVFGAGTVLIPWAVIELVSQNQERGLGLLVLYGIITAARYFIEPKIIGKKFGMNPLLSLASLFIGLKLFGFIGMISFPILVSVAVILQKNGLIKLWK